MSKNKKITLLALFSTLTLLLFATTACAQTGTGGNNVITTTGSGLVYTAPNTAKITLSVVTENAAADKAQSENARLVKATTGALREAGIHKDDISTSGYYLNPKYIYADNTAPRISGYEVRNEIKVTIKDIDQVGSIIDLAVQSGVNQVQNIQFYALGTLEQRKEALGQAVDDARMKAEVMAAALGKKIVGIKSATGNWYDSDPSPIMFRQEVKQYGVSEDSATSVEPGQVEIRASAEVVYLIQ